MKVNWFKQFFKFAWLTNPFKKVMDAAELAYNSLDSIVQNATKKASTIIAIINANLDKTPDFIYSLIQKYFPEFNQDDLKNYLNKLNTLLYNISSSDNSLLQALSLVQNYLSQYKDNPWIVISQKVVALLVDILTGDYKVIIQQVMICLEHVYIKYVRPFINSLMQSTPALALGGTTNGSNTTTGK